MALRFLAALIGIACLVFVLPDRVLSASAQSANPPSLTLAHSYDVSGTNPNGSRYSGTLAVEIISDTTYTVRWNISGTPFRGFGMRMNNALSATYTIDGQPGLIMYEVKEGGVLEGIWAVRGRSGFGTERLTPRN